MEVLGIIAEFNPLHNGHKYLINEAKKHGTVICAVSGNFLQRGDTAIFEKRNRAKAALSCGADLVVELPVCYSMSTAQNFALGGVSILAALGCNTLMFGSECGDVDTLVKTSEILTSDKFSKVLPSYLEKGLTFAKARQCAAEDCGAPKGILEGANNNLAVEYITAARNINCKMTFKTVKRVGTMHDSDDLNGTFASASAIREIIKTNGLSDCEKYLPLEAYNIFKTADYSDILNIDNAIMAVLRSKPKSDFYYLPDLSEGVENKLYSAIKKSAGFDELCQSIKVKRYTLARIRRLVLSAFLSIDNRLFMKTPPYVRILGFNKTGETFLRQTKEQCPIPVIMRVNEIDGLDDNAHYMFEVENRATDLYALSFKKPFDCSLEYTAGLIKWDF